MSKRYPYNQLRRFLVNYFEIQGFSAVNSNKIAHTLLDADVRGIPSHGIQRLPMYDKKLANHDIIPNQQGEVVYSTAISAVIDGKLGMGQLIALNAMELAIKKAKLTGIGIVSVRASNHFGAAGYYSRLASRLGLIGVSMTNTNPLIVPTNAKNAFLGSNPLAVAFPAVPYDFVFDAATSSVSLGEFEIYHKQGKKISGEWAIDGMGHIIRNPQEVLDSMAVKERKGGILPIGGLGEINSGYKGYGLALLVEIFTSILSQGAISRDIATDGVSHFFVAIDPKIFVEEQIIKQNLAQLLKEIRQLSPIDVEKAVRVPGDREEMERKNSIKYGILLEEEIIKDLRQLANQYHIPFNIS